MYQEKISEYIGPCSEEELGQKICDFIDTLDLPPDSFTPDKKQVWYLLSGKYSGYHEIPPGAETDRFNIDDHNWFSILKTYDLNNNVINYRFVAFIDKDPG